MSDKPIYTGDLETDPFKKGRFPLPFVSGLYDGAKFHWRWGVNCIEQMMEVIDDLPPGIIYFHNGGRFDFFYFMKYILGSKMMIVASRILKATIKCKGGTHELRDSYGIMPFALSKYKKDEIDYSLMEKDQREKHKEKILSYLEGDCVYLHELCVAFGARFGSKLTIGSTSMRELQEIHEFRTLDEEQDRALRSHYYYGGRVQCFKSGILPGKWKVYDVNSMYPFVMQNFKHPIGTPSWESDTISKHTCFISAEGKNNGAFPQRTKSGIRFDNENGIFEMSIHEWRIAVRYGLFEPRRIIKTINFDSRSSFKKFVNTFYHARIEAKANGDVANALFYKYILNSAYGKFAQNPENYCDYQITPASEILEGWEPAFIFEDEYIIWKKSSKDYQRYNVATAASITGAARAVLLEAIATAVNPIYCDTDSIICEELPNVAIDPSQLGAWKLEAEADRACIAGKKLYALFNGAEVIKQANKGVRITAQEIEQVCAGKTITSIRDAPSFKLGSKFNALDKSVRYSFIERKVRMTA